MMTPEERRASIKYNRFLRETGRPRAMISPEEHVRVKAHLRVLHYDYGLSWEFLGKLIGRSHGNGLARHLEGEYNGMRRSVYDKVMAISPIQVDRERITGRSGRAMGAFTSNVGSQRRIQALNAIGFDCAWLDRVYLKIAVGASARMSRGARRQITYDTHVRIKEMYDKLEGCDPRDFGIRTDVMHRTIIIAKGKDYPPPGCWDPDTIDDPEAIPEWTGHCGTQKGWEIHLRDGIDMCPACRAVKGVDERVVHTLSNMDKQARTAYCSGCEREVHIILHGSSCSRGPRYRCGPHMRNLQAIRAAKKKNQDTEIDRLTDEGKSAREIAATLHITTRTITRRRAVRNGG